MGEKLEWLWELDADDREPMTIDSGRAATDSDGAFLFLGQAEFGCAEDRHMDRK